MKFLFCAWNLVEEFPKLRLGKAMPEACSQRVERLCRGLGCPQPAFQNIQKDILKHCWRKLSAQEYSVNSRGATARHFLFLQTMNQNIGK